MVNLRCKNPEPRVSQLGHSLQVRPRPLVHKCPLCINTDRKFWTLGFVAMGHKRTDAPPVRRQHFNGSSSTPRPRVAWHFRD